MPGMQGRCYIVTGAASGIGQATAERLLGEGAYVMGADLNEPTAKRAGNRRSDGKWAFTAEVQVKAVILWRGTSTWATCPRACTPESVRPAPCNRTGVDTSCENARLR